MSRTINVCIIEDDQDIRKELSQIIDMAEGINCIQKYYNIESAEKDLIDEQPDVIIMDISLPGMNGIEGTKLFKSKYPSIEIIMLTVHQEDNLVFESLCAGACGYLTKITSPDKIIASIREAFNGGAPMSMSIARMVVSSFKTNDINDKLSPREQDVLQELCQGKSYRLIASALFISEDTVRSHIRHIYKKLEVHSKSAAVAKAIKNKWV